MGKLVAGLFTTSSITDVGDSYGNTISNFVQAKNEGNGLDLNTNGKAEQEE